MLGSQCHIGRYDLVRPARACLPGRVCAGLKGRALPRRRLVINGPRFLLLHVYSSYRSRYVARVQCHIIWQAY